MLTEKKVERTNTPGRYGDTRGLYLQVQGPKAKAWLFRYERAVRGPDGEILRKPNGRPRVKEYWLGLGSAADFTLEEARERARTMRRVLSDGGDPAADRKAMRAARAADAAARANVMTFKAAAEAFFASKSVKWSNSKHRAQFSSTMEAYVYPILGDLPVAEIDTPLVLRVLNQPIAGEGKGEAERFWLARPETASRTRRRIEWVLSWATVSKHRSGPNPAAWRNHLDHVLPARADVKKTEHHKALPWKQVPALMAALKEREGVAAEALRFLVLTAARTGEIVGAKWSEIDLKAKVWTVPAERMKAKKEHRVPLSAEAIGLLKALPREGDFVFPGAKANAPVSNMSLTMTMRRAGYGDVTVHGLRSSFRDWAAHTSHSREAIELALAHTVGNRVEQAYFRDDLFAPRIALMRDWATFATGPVPVEDAEPEEDNLRAIGGAR